MAMRKLLNTRVGIESKIKFSEVELALNRHIHLQHHSLDKSLFVKIYFLMHFICYNGFFYSFTVSDRSDSFMSGCPVGDDSQECRNPFNVFQGCMRLLTLDNQRVDLIMVQRKQLGNYSNLHIDMCGIIDRSVSKKT